MPWLNDPLAESKASAFVSTTYRPANHETQLYIEILTTSLGLPNREKYKNCVASVVAACQLANNTANPLIAFSMNSNDYAGKAIGHRVAKDTLSVMQASGKLVLHTERVKGRARCYSFHDLDLDGQYTNKITDPVEIRSRKSNISTKSRRLTRKETIALFGSKFTEEELRIGKLNLFLGSHQLSSPSGVAWGAVARIFNNSSMQEGGRLYGYWQNLKVEERLQLRIDNFEVAEIDITACFLFIASALAGQPIADEDPYSTVPWVQNENTRALAKRLVSILMFKTGEMVRFSAGLKREFDIPKRKSIKDYTPGIYGAFPFLEHSSSDGFIAMHKESEAILTAIEILMERGIAAYPVHDCLLVPKQHVRIASAAIVKSFQIMFDGQAPYLTIETKNDRFSLKPEEAAISMLDL